MAHTNDATKGAQLKLFANMVQFGSVSVFFMVTPEDKNSFRIQVYIATKHRDLPSCYDVCSKIDANYECSHKIHREYLGLCAFSFDQIMELLVYHILGWDQSPQQPRPGSGAFGVLDAWSHSIEEQGQKTLHGHYILWVQGWSTLLVGLQSNDMLVHDEATKKLSKYIDGMLSTRLFATLNSPIQDAYDHKCTLQLQCHPLPTICEDQLIQNLCYKCGTSNFRTDKFLKCPDCGTLFNMDELVNNVLTKMVWQ